MFLFKNESDLEWNVRTHNKIAKKYERIHGEIYNSHEQSRLRNALKEAISDINTGCESKLVLDFGCGAGNLTGHLTFLGCEVVACDVSQGFLDLLASRSYTTNVETAKLNGVDLSNIPSDSVDMVATYSVLHHVPDYLGILTEFMRVLKPGGVVFIDHEPSDEFWLKGHAYLDFEQEMKQNTRLDLKKYFIPTNYYDWLIRRFVNPRYHREGDIHVFDDDHVEWSKVTSALVKAGGEVVFEADYLLYRRNYDILIYNKHKDKTTDMHLLVVKKL
ncbi:class I SAM-dependent methyltransferase [Mariprofundus sp. NF]|uniref:class I SAM-dependent methyltransferase n=1 Tax=Mariprofundus sp. NF TaxID=2608716 RepID=UPI0015A0521E|nr:class I SAM-dependent methyltransferase [Mariprofundus sp. NF]